MGYPHINMTEKNKFRLDINGLRAWAVISVVLYHFGLDWLSGGFVGVDVFFVISGYLMTGIIADGISEQKFSLWSFYLARARRIVPALLFVSTSLLVLGWFLLMPSEYQTLGKHVRDTVLFSSNLRYLGEAGYFDIASEQKWLLHSWSLSVEWQFYLLFPVIVMVANRLAPGMATIRSVVVVLFLVSTAWSFWLSGTDAERAFFTLGSRAWQMAAGGLVWLWLQRQRELTARPLVTSIGLALILLAATCFDEATRWPLPWAIVPVLGAVLVLAGQWQRSWLLISRPMQWFGSRSYSIYLWHWPIVVGLSYFEYVDDPRGIALGIMASLVAGECSYRFIEEPGREHLGRRRQPSSIIALLALTALLASTAQVVRKQEFLGRLPVAVAALEAERSNRSRYLETCKQSTSSCRLGNGEAQVILLGDSHAGALMETVQAAAGGPQASVLFYGNAGCLLVFGARREGETGRACEAAQVRAEQELPGLPAHIPAILILRTSAYLFGGSPGESGQRTGKPEYHFSRPVNEPNPQFLNEFRQHYLQTACEIARERPLYIVRPLPEMPVDVPNAMARDLLLGRTREIGITLKEYRERHAFVWQVQDEAREKCGARVLDPIPYLCRKDFCPGAMDGKPLYYDDDHLGRRGAVLLESMFDKVLR